MSKWDHRNRDKPFNVATSVTLDPGQQATVTFTVDDRLSDYFLPTLAISKFDNSEYEIIMDGTGEYGPAPIPPTDPDDDSDTFRPPETFSDEVEVNISNLDSSLTRTYFVQAVGWERRTDGGL